MASVDPHETGRSRGSGQGLGPRARGPHGSGPHGPGTGPRLRILGVDPGSRATGYGVIERDGGALRHVAHGVLRPRSDGSPAQRLAALTEGLREVIARHAPDVASVEEVFVAASPRAALVLGQARGAALVALGAAALPLVEYTPARIKQSVSGSGRAPKVQMQRMVRRLLTLERLPAADAADALAAAICHAHAGPLEGLVRRTPRRGRARGASFRVRRAR